MQDFVLTITDVNEAPVFTSATGFSNALATAAAVHFRKQITPFKSDPKIKPGPLIYSPGPDFCTGLRF